jgi:hypothetical protein
MYCVDSGIALISRTTKNKLKLLSKEIHFCLILAILINLIIIFFCDFIEGKPRCNCKNAALWFGGHRFNSLPTYWREKVKAVYIYLPSLGGALCFRSPIFCVLLHNFDKWLVKFVFREQMTYMVHLLRIKLKVILTMNNLEIIF